MEVGDRFVVHERRHPYYKCTGKIIGKRGARSAVPGDTWLWVYIDNPNKPCMIPQSMVEPEKKGLDNDGQDMN
jgi:hypothetical protein